MTTNENVKSWIIQDFIANLVHTDLAIMELKDQLLQTDSAEEIASIAVRIQDATEYMQETKRLLNQYLTD